MRRGAQAVGVAVVVGGNHRRGDLTAQSASLPGVINIKLLCLLVIWMPHDNQLRPVPRIGPIGNGNLFNWGRFVRIVHVPYEVSRGERQILNRTRSRYYLPAGIVLRIPFIDAMSYDSKSRFICKAQNELPTTQVVALFWFKIQQRRLDLRVIREIVNRIKYFFRECEVSSRIEYGQMDGLIRFPPVVNGDRIPTGSHKVPRRHVDLGTVSVLLMGRFVFELDGSDNRPICVEFTAIDIHPKAVTAPIRHLRHRKIEVAVAVEIPYSHGHPTGRVIRRYRDAGQAVEMLVQNVHSNYITIIVADSRYNYLIVTIVVALHEHVQIAHRHVHGLVICIGGTVKFNPI